MKALVCCMGLVLWPILGISDAFAQALLPADARIEAGLERWRNRLAGPKTVASALQRDTAEMTAKDPSFAKWIDFLALQYERAAVMDLASWEKARARYDDLRGSFDSWDAAGTEKAALESIIEWGGPTSEAHLIPSETWQTWLLENVPLSNDTWFWAAEYGNERVLINHCLSEVLPRYKEAGGQFREDTLQMITLLKDVNRVMPYMIRDREAYDYAVWIHESWEERVARSAGNSRFAQLKVSLQAETSRKTFSLGPGF